MCDDFLDIFIIAVGYPPILDEIGYKTEKELIQKNIPILHIAGTINDINFLEKNAAQLKFTDGRVVKLENCDKIIFHNHQYIAIKYYIKHTANVFIATENIKEIPK